MLDYILTADARLTTRLRNFGKRQEKFWQLVAGKGISLFAVIGLVIAYFHPVDWYALLLPIVAAYLATTIAQFLLARPRPDSHKHERYSMWWRTFSFPSGHATVAAAAATVLTIVPSYPDSTSQLLVALTLGTLGLLIALARIMVGVHYVSDMLAGLCIGLLAGLWPKL